MSDGPSSILYPRPPAPAPPTSIPLALHFHLQLHVLIKEESMSPFSCMRVDFALQLLHEHPITLTCWAIPVIAKVMGFAGGVHRIDGCPRSTASRTAPLVFRENT